MPVKSDKPVVVEVRFKCIAVLDAVDEVLEEQDKGTPAAAKRAQQRAKVVELVKQNAERGITSHWNNKFKIEIKDPQCGTKVLPIVYKPVFVESGEHYVLKVHKKFDREQVFENVVDVSLGTTDWTHAHEFGHCCGLPDEYSYTDGVDETVKYYKPDGTLSEAIFAPFDGKDPKAADATIMAAYGCTIVKPRHAWNIAIEVQALLRAKIGRNITCDIL